MLDKYKKSTNPSFWPTQKKRIHTAEGNDRKIKVRPRLQPKNPTLNLQEKVEKK